jgi:hypothetical protein
MSRLKRFLIHQIANRASVRSNATIFTDTALQELAIHRPRGTILYSFTEQQTKQLSLSCARSFGRTSQKIKLTDGMAILWIQSKSTTR